VWHVGLPQGHRWDLPAWLAEIEDTAARVVRCGSRWLVGVVVGVVDFGMITWGGSLGGLVCVPVTYVALGLLVILLVFSGSVGV
jgi:hypothetical protein